MKQYTDAIKIIEQAITGIRETHIMPQDLRYAESTLKLAVLFLESSDKKRTEEAKILSGETK
jgi:hypothetical protein